MNLNRTERRRPRRLTTCVCPKPARTPALRFMVWGKVVRFWHRLRHQ